ncbi:MAG: cytoplasmic protein [bacterium]|nr:cytoplasmic protein [bacterium]
MKTSDDPIVTSSEIYGVIFENEKVRVIKSIMKVGAKAQLHHHPDRVIYVVNGAHLKIKSSGMEWDNKILKTGDVYWASAVDHEVENIGPTDSYNIVVELK